MKDQGWKTHRKFLKTLKDAGPIETIATRLIQYAEETKVSLIESNCYFGWGVSGLSNLRGFAPQRRVVLANRKDPLLEGQQNDDAWESFFFHLHDLLHVVYYDFAALHYGFGHWSEKEFFVPVHLLSEACSVLLLDYWGLAQSDLRTLGTKRFYDSGVAVDVHFRHFKTNARPDFQSEKFVKDLISLYATGKSALFHKMARSPLPTLRNWAGHEIRYSDKQHRYVLNWWAHFHNEPIREEIRLDVFATDPQSVQGLLHLRDVFCDDRSKPFLQHIERVRETLDQFDGTYFDFEMPVLNDDFRFKNAFSLSLSEIRKFLEQPEKAEDSFHFLIGQLICSLDPDKYPELIVLADRVFARQSELRENYQEVLRDEMLEKLKQIYLRASYRVPDVFYLS